MADDTTDTDAPAADTNEAGESGQESERKGGVSTPGWLAAALVVLLGLGIGAAGFAVGRSTAPDDGPGFTPIVRQVPGFGGPGGEGRDGFPQLPGPGGRGGEGPGGFPQLPGGPGGPGGVGPGGEHGNRDGRGDNGERDEGSQGDDTPTSSTVPGGLPGA